MIFSVTNGAKFRDADLGCDGLVRLVTADVSVGDGVVTLIDS